MATFEELVTNQKQTGANIENIIRNYKKDPAARKISISYFQERLKRLDEAWSAFETTDNQIRLLEKIPLDHSYFKEDYYTAIMDAVQQYKEEFEQAMLEINPPKAPATLQQRKDSEAASIQIDELVKLSRRQSAMMSTLERLLQNQFTNDDISSATKIWQAIEDLHYQISEICSEGGNKDYNMDRFIQLENQVRVAIRAVANTTTNNNNLSNVNGYSETIPIPKITIPRFDGNYMKWQEFYDLFLSLVVNQSMPKVQKIWYLKTHLIGEAANLIKHFSATGENFDAAWEIVKNRYNNKRLLVNKLLQELVDAPNKPTCDNYKALHDKTKECLLSLNNLQVETSSWDPLLLHLLLKRIDQATRLRYEQSLSKPREVPTIQEFLLFLERNFQSMEAVIEKPSNSKAKVCTSIIHPTQNNGFCIMCKNTNHPLFVCKEFLQLSAAARLQFIQKNQYCVNCLKAGHRAKTCISRSCTKCNKRHNTLLHLDGLNQKLVSTTNNPRSEENSSTTTKASPVRQGAASLTAAKRCNFNNYVLLSTARVIVKANGREVQCRAILDSGSQINLVSERLVKRLGMTSKPASIYIDGIGSRATKVQKRVNIALHSRVSNFNTRLEAAVLPHIISPQPSQQIQVENWPIPKEINLADPEFNRPDKIDILLGAEFYHQLLTVGQIQMTEKLPTLQNTVLGWVISGKISTYNSTTAACGICTETDSSLEKAIAQLWELENITAATKPMSVSEKHCEDHFTQNHTIDLNGRFMVRIPFCDNPNALGESHEVSFNRFLSLEKRLAKNPELKNQYVQFMREYEALGHMTLVGINSMRQPNYIIPHHCILKPESSTTKLRVVFDASTKTSTGLSLNDVMYTGPTVQSELFSILLRFRQPRYAFTTDIEKMYRQILMHPEDRRFQTIIWREDPATPIQYYQLNTITYGTRAAPYLATKCLQTIAKTNMARHPNGARFLLENFYVDDGIGGDDDLHTALAIQKELQHMLSQHGLKLQKWAANHKKLLQNVEEEQQEVTLDFNSENNHTVKTLGLTWMTKSDKFCVKVCLGKSQHITKRSITSDLARLFDPLGLLSPVVVTAKLFIQELWQLKFDWDMELPPQLHAKWMEFRADLESVNNLQIARHIFEGNVSSTIQIHAFSDASERAYGAAIYVRAVIKNDQVIVRLLCAKSRVAPLKHQTLPRLELCAALLCAELTARVKTDLRLENSPTYFWTDSEIVLAWINSQSSSYQTFVANRIAAIQELSTAEQWRHVNSKDNPADILSRGLPPRKLASNSLWFYGPIFLHGPNKLFPQEYQKAHCTSKVAEMERKKVAAVTTSTEPSTSIVYEIQHKGSFRTLQRVVGYMLRFINMARKHNKQSELALSVNELEQALVVIVRAIQQSDFEEDLKNLQKHNQVNKGSQYSNLSPFLDTNGIIRVGGRLESSVLPYDAKHPMLIPYNDPISKLLMQTLHETNRHCGPQALLAYARQRYWPVKGKSAARAIVQNCVKCAKAKPKLLDQLMGNLPSTRVTSARPFINSGVDFCGPFWIHYKVRGKKPQKAYIAVFCCFATKAVHLELVSDLTTEAFIGALKRFISRRGHCKNLYCDNATNFVGAKNQLNELSKILYENSAHEKIQKDCTSRGITFHFIPPRSPHFGGLWEAAVKSAKHLLVRSTSTASLTYEELETVVIEIEGILNSRPIGPMSDNPNDLAALTPGHFLIGEPLNAQFNTADTQQKFSLLTRWKLVTQLKTEFWRRWSNEYLCELQYRHKWKTQKDNIKPGDMVVIKEDNTPPLQWPLGRIVKVHKGDDGVVRVADIRTSKGVSRRPIARLAPLPVKGMEQDDTSDQGEPNQGKSAHNEDIEIPKKRRRPSIHHNLFTVMMGIFLLPLVLGAQVHNTPFGNRLGIHFEGIGTAAVSSSEWQLLIYYDLTEFWTELKIFSQGTQTLNHFCKKMQEQATCKNLVKYFEYTNAELTMDSTLLSGRRQKRAAIDLVGNIAHSLFGVLDSEYAKDMALTVSQVKENEEHLLNLLKNQSSIIDSTINIMKSDQAEVKKKFDQIDVQISAVHNMIITGREEHHQENLYRIFSSLCMQLTISASNLQRIQSSIFDVLTNTHHGIINPLLLTPQQLQDEAKRIRFHLPDTLDLPVKQEDTLQLYKLMKVKGGLTKNTAIFRVTLPLIERDTFDIFNIVPIPNWINNTLISIQPCSAILIINIRLKQYFAISDSEFNSCTHLTQNLYLCSKSQIKYEQGSSKCACEINLFHNNSQSDCPVQRTEDNAVWIPMRHKNKWIYALTTPSQATTVCKQEITQLTLEGSGLLELDPECTLKHKFITIQGQQNFSSSLKASYNNLWELTERIHETRLKPLLNELHINKYASQIKNLTTLQASLAAHEILQLPNKIEAHNNHHLTVGYTALVITIGIVIYLIVKRRSKKASVPIPTPRTTKQQSTTDFTVHL